MVGITEARQIPTSNAKYSGSEERESQSIAYRGRKGINLRGETEGNRKGLTKRHRSAGVIIFFFLIGKDRP